MPDPLPDHPIGRARPGTALPARAAALPLALLALFILAPGCARPLPPQPSTSALYRDLHRLVSLRAATGWYIDRLELDELLPDALMSVCQVQPGHRALLRDWLDARIAALGGPVEQAYRARGRDLDRVSELLALTRVRMTLTRAMDAAGADCPFWLEPRPVFRGRQISDDRWQISIAGGGRGVLKSRGDKQDMHIGGSGRLLFGRNLGRDLAIYTGAETGGTASFPKDASGERSNLVLTLDAVVPAVVRYRLTNTYIEAEAGYLARTTEEELGQIEHGLHLGVAVGGRTQRVRFLFPGAALNLSYERTFPDGAASLHMVKIGFRAVADFDL